MFQYLTDEMEQNQDRKMMQASEATQLGRNERKMVQRDTTGEPSPLAICPDHLGDERTWHQLLIYRDQS